MNRLEKARWRNIMHKAAKANRLLKKGYLIYDHFGDKFGGFKYCKQSEYLYEDNGDCRTVWLGKKKMWNSSLDIPIKQYNADHFDKWTAVHPRHFKKI